MAGLNIFVSVVHYRPRTTLIFIQDLIYDDGCVERSSSSPVTKPCDDTAKFDCDDSGITGVKNVPNPDGVLLKYAKPL